MMCSATFHSDSTNIQTYNHMLTSIQQLSYFNFLFLSNAPHWHTARKYTHTHTQYRRSYKQGKSRKINISHRIRSVRTTQIVFPQQKWWKLMCVLCSNLIHLKVAQSRAIAGNSPTGYRNKTRTNMHPTQLPRWFCLVKHVPCACCANTQLYRPLDWAGRGRKLCAIDLET